MLCFVHIYNYIIVWRCLRFITPERGEKLDQMILDKDSAKLFEIIREDLIQYEKDSKYHDVLSACAIEYDEKDAPKDLLDLMRNEPLICVFRSQYVYHTSTKEFSDELYKLYGDSDKLIRYFEDIGAIQLSINLKQYISVTNNTKNFPLMHLNISKIFKPEDNIIETQCAVLLDIFRLAIKIVKYKLPYIKEAIERIDIKARNLIDPKLKDLIVYRYDHMYNHSMNDKRRIKALGNLENIKSNIDSNKDDIFNHIFNYIQAIVDNVDNYLLFIQKPSIMETVIDRAKETIKSLILAQTPSQLKAERFSSFIPIPLPSNSFFTRAVLDAMHLHINPREMMYGVYEFIFEDGKKLLLECTPRSGDKIIELEQCPIRQIESNLTIPNLYNVCDITGNILKYFKYIPELHDWLSYNYRSAVLGCIYNIYAQKDVDWTVDAEYPPLKDDVMDWVSKDNILFPNDLTNLMNIDDFLSYLYLQYDLETLNEEYYSSITPREIDELSYYLINRHLFDEIFKDKSNYVTFQKDIGKRSLFSNTRHFANYRDETTYDVKAFDDGSILLAENYKFINHSERYNMYLKIFPIYYDHVHIIIKEGRDPHPLIGYSTGLIDSADLLNYKLVFEDNMFIDLQDYTYDMYNKPLIQYAYISKIFAKTSMIRFPFVVGIALQNAYTGKYIAHDKDLFMSMINLTNDKDVPKNTTSLDSSYWPNFILSVLLNTRHQRPFSCAPTDFMINLFGTDNEKRHKKYLLNCITEMVIAYVMLDGIVRDFFKDEYLGNPDIDINAHSFDDILTQIRYYNKRVGGI